MSDPTAVTFALCCITLGVLIGVIVILLVAQANERRDWAAERRSLIDRSISRHVGEVVALDRAAAPRPTHDQTERPHAVGL